MVKLRIITYLIEVADGYKTVEISSDIGRAVYGKSTSVQHKERRPHDEQEHNKKEGKGAEDGTTQMPWERIN